ncbi:LOW QUALITY PROTEIN: hypothetical protein ACHAW5_007243 [Stephanodiscus triporus]|uniref:Ubiquitin-like protease family profile domain-containing protein n=1 Tax=Stephanodiscus triporus TaxID=2934178 RepID=A0ABD3QGH4_9STRA
MVWLQTYERNRMRHNLLSRRSYAAGGGAKRTPIIPALAAPTAADGGVDSSSSSGENRELEGGGGGGKEGIAIISPGFGPRRVPPPPPSSFLPHIQHRHHQRRRRIYVDSRTVRAMRAEVEDLPLPATLSSVCLALRVSDAVLEAHADATRVIRYPKNDDDDSKMKSLEIVGTFLSEMSLSSSSSSSSPEEERDRRREEFRTACITLASKGNDAMMKSWEEVEEGLSDAFLFARFDAETIVVGGGYDAIVAFGGGDDDDGGGVSTPSRAAAGVSRGADHRRQTTPPRKSAPKRASRPSPKIARPIAVPPSSSVVGTPPAAAAAAARGGRDFLSIEMYRQKIMQKIGRASFLRIFRQGEILLSRPAVVPSLLDERIERLESELPSTRRIDEIIAAKEREDMEREARESAMKLMRPLTAEERRIVVDATEGIGPPTEILAKQGADSVQRGSMQTLRPGQWLNDEVINYFLKNCLARRDEKMCARDAGRRRSHFFNSFFVQTMFDEKNNDPKLRGRYNYKNVKRWSKKVPGKDIFNLKYILCPINLDNTHWTSAVIFMEDKRIQYYDSMGGTDRSKLEGLLEYVKDEYRAKNGKELDVTEWELVSCTSDTPRQRNGYDCGVFTCMFCDFISKDCSLVFNQDHIDQCRDRIALSIMNNCAIE